jgi:hypothetical protein
MYIAPMDDMIRQFIGFDQLAWPDLAMSVEKAFATGAGVTPAPTRVSNLGMAFALPPCPALAACALVLSTAGLWLSSARIGVQPVLVLTAQAAARWAPLC